ncbi:MAG: 50S ribosomal protein L19e [Candidatus Asgardarchaeia archaeon]
MNLKIQRKLIARTLGVGVDRVWIDPERIDEVSLLAQRSEIHKLIHDGVIRIKPVRGTSRVRARLLHEKKKKGLRRGMGKRKGKKTARIPRKLQWMIRVRALRKHLRELKEKQIISKRVYRDLYIKVSSGVFHSIRHLDNYIIEHNLSDKLRR